MAYYADPEKDEKESQASSGPAQLGPSGSGIVDGSTASAGASASGAPNAQSTPDKSGNFVGISTYLNANRPQAEKLGDQASGVINNSANDARSSLNSLNDTFNQQAGSAVSLDQNALGKVNQAETLNDNEKNTLKNQYNANYAGPNSLQDLSDPYNETTKKLATAKQNVESSGTETGRQGLITQINDKPRNAGITNFDSVLLQAGGGREKLAQAANQNKDVTGDMLGAANITAQQKAADIKSQDDATRTATQGAVTGATDTFNQTLAQKVKDALGKTVNLNNAYTQDIADTSLNQNTLGAFGLNDKDHIYDLDLNKYITQGDPNAINSANVADQTDYARYLALMGLSGGTPSTLTQDTMNQAGTAKVGPTIDTTGLRAAIDTKNNGYNTQYNSPDTKILDKNSLDTITAVRDRTANRQPEIWRALSGIESASPKALETQYIPAMQNIAATLPGGRDNAMANTMNQLIKQAQDSISQWRAGTGYNRQVTKEG